MNYEYLAPCPPSFPNIIIEKCKGAEVFDKSGRCYLDFSGAALAIGHCHPMVVKAVSSEIGKVTGFTGLVAYTTKYLELARKLKDIVPIRDAKVAYATTGSEACDFAINLARWYTKRPVIVSFHGAYHGLTGFSLSSSPMHGYRKVFPIRIENVYSPYPYCYRCPFKQSRDSCNIECLSYLEDDVLRYQVEPEDVAAIIIEPLQSHGGILVPRKEFMLGVRKIADNIGALLIVDEVYTGFGRTGKWFGVQHYNIEPDVICLGKGLGGGFPIAAIVAKGKIMENWTLCSGGSLGTFAGHHISATAALATIDAIEKEKLVDNAMYMGQKLINGLMDLKSRYNVVGDVRGLGLVLGVEIVKADGSPDKKGAFKLKSILMKKGLLIIPVGKYDNVLKVTPPIVINEEQVERTLEILEDSLKEFTQHIKQDF